VGAGTSSSVVALKQGMSAWLKVDSATKVMSAQA
jgi:hypothetical protein